MTGGDSRTAKELIVGVGNGFRALMNKDIWYVL